MDNVLRLVLRGDAPVGLELAGLIEIARQAASEAWIAFKLDSVEARREVFLAYGRALMPIRAWFNDPRRDREYNACLKAHNLEVSTKGFRSDCLWLAENWGGLQTSVILCPYANPVDIRQWLREQRGPKPYSGDEEWYTPDKYIKRVKNVLGGIDLDPASSKQAQRIVDAANFITKAEDALGQEWHGRVWLNPPYSKGLLFRFVDKLVHEVTVGHTMAAIMLLNNFSDADWFQCACSICSAVCFPRGRIHFENVSGKTDRPLNGQVFFYYGDAVDKFQSEFRALGCGFVGAGSWQWHKTSP